MQTRVWKPANVVLVLALILTLFSVAASSMASAAESKKFLVVMRQEAVTAADLKAIAAAGGTVTRRVDQIGVLEVTTSNPTAFLKKMVSNPAIQSIGPAIPVTLDQPLRTQAEGAAVPTSDPLVSTNPADYTWGIDRVTNNGAAWETTTGTKDVVVGVIDSGFDFSHPDLAPNIVPGSKTFVPGTTDAWDAMGHGTHVAGTIAANGRIKGVAPDVGLRAYRVFDQGGAASIWVHQAIIAAANDGVDVINMSLGGLYVHGQIYYTDPETGERIRLGGETADIVARQRAIRYATNRNVTVVAAAGNDFADLTNKNALTDLYNALLVEWGYPEFEVIGATFVLPAQTPGVVTVSATGGGFGTTDRLAFYSNYGYGAINLGAPGGDLGPDIDLSDPSTWEPDFYKYLVLSTYPTYPVLFGCWSIEVALFDCDYAFFAGTSMAAPHVAGTAALIIAEEYERTGVKPSPAQVVTMLQQTAEDIGKVGYDNLYGHGLVNADSALNAR